MEYFRYLGIDIAANNRMENEPTHRLEKIESVGVLRAYDVSIAAKIDMYVVILLVLYGCETWMLNAWESQLGKHNGNEMFKI